MSKSPRSIFDSAIRCPHGPVGRLRQSAPRRRDSSLRSHTTVYRGYRLPNALIPRRCAQLAAVVLARALRARARKERASAVDQDHHWIRSTVPHRPSDLSILHRRARDRRPRDAVADAPHTRKSPLLISASLAWSRRAPGRG